MKNKFYLAIGAVALGCILYFTGCGTKPEGATEIEATDDTPLSIIEEDSGVAITADQLAPYICLPADVIYPDKAIIALGEATHGNREFTELKLSVFQQLVEQQGIRVFVLEGDFGGCRFVNDYIQTGQGTAQEAAAAIGFAIYRTEEMAALIEWMRGFNEGREERDRVRFYGFDMQRFDHNKTGLYTILDNAAPDLAQEYKTLLQDVTDQTMYDLATADWESILAGLEELNAALEAQKETAVGAVSEKEYALAVQYAQCIRENTELRLAGGRYGTLRDAFMAEKVDWILAFEKANYGNEKLFITGHNGHVGKVTATFGTEKIMGQLLAEKYGEEYFVIGTEFFESVFLAADQTTGERLVYTLENSGEDRLAVLLHQLDMAALYFDMQAALAAPDIEYYLYQKQAMTSIGDAFSSFHAASQGMYTQKLAPAGAYDAILFMDSLTPSLMLPEA